MNVREYEKFLDTYGEDFATHNKSLLADLNEWRKWPWGNKVNFWATDITKCERFMFLAMWNIPESNGDLSDDTINTFAVGNKVEEHIVEKFRTLQGRMWEQPGGSFWVPGTEEEVQFLFDTYGLKSYQMFLPKVSYKMDIVFDDLSRRIHEKKIRRYIVEVKSTKDFPFSTHTKQGSKDPYWYGYDAAPGPDHFLQLHQYLYGEGVVDGLLVYFDKNTSEELVWQYERDEELMNDIVLERYRMLYYNYVHRLLPDRPYIAVMSKKGDRIIKTGSDWQCRYCAQSSRCWGLDGYEPLEDVEQLNFEETEDMKKVQPYEEEKPKKKSRRRKRKPSK